MRDNLCHGLSVAHNYKALSSIASAIDDIGETPSCFGSLNDLMHSNSIIRFSDFTMTPKTTTALLKQDSRQMGLGVHF